MVNKFTLSSGKKIYLRDPRIADHETCASACGGTKDNLALLGIIMQREMLKQLLCGISQKDSEEVEELQPTTLKLDDVFTYKEFNEAQKAIKMLTDGDDGPNELKLELVSL